MLDPAMLATYANQPAAAPSMPADAAAPAEDKPAEEEGEKTPTQQLASLIHGAVADLRAAQEKLEEAAGLVEELDEVPAKLEKNLDKAAESAAKCADEIEDYAEDVDELAKEEADELAALEEEEAEE